MLIRLASLLKNTVRTEDIVARLGGDEFCVVFPRTSADNAATALERTRKEFSEIGIDAADGRRMEVSATFGVADFNSAIMSSADEVFEAADRALYSAKEGGRNKVGIN